MVKIAENAHRCESKEDKATKEVSRNKIEVAQCASSTSYNKSVPYSSFNKSCKNITIVHLESHACKRSFFSVLLSNEVSNVFISRTQAQFTAAMSKVQARTQSTILRSSFSKLCENRTMLHLASHDCKYNSFSLSYVNTSSPRHLIVRYLQQVLP